MHTEIPPLSLSFWRWVTALIILCSFASLQFFKQRKIVKKHLVFISVQGVLGVGVFNTLIYIAMQTTTAINAVLINSCIPVLIATCSWMLYGEMMTLRQYFGILISLSGVVLIIAAGKLATLMSVSFNHGDILVLAAAFVWALYSTNLKKYPAELHPFSYQIGIVISGLLVILPFYLLEFFSGIHMHVTYASISTILYVALFASVLAFIFWNKAVRTVGANKAGPFIHLMPVFSSILAVIFLGESLEPYHLQGITLIFSGIVMTTYKGAR